MASSTFFYREEDMLGWGVVLTGIGAGRWQF
jgi:hypothetical protein